MVTAEVARNIVGILGNVISLGLFLSPVPTFYHIWKKKDVEEFQPYPYVATVMNCSLWVFYGLPMVKPDSLLVATINGTGLVIELIYLSVFYFFDSHAQTRKNVAWGVLMEGLAMAAIVVVTLLAMDTHVKRTYFVGILGDIFNVIMYGSPLAIMRKVVETKSVEFMPLYLSLANFANGCIWTAYALIKFDVFILISNCIGAIFGVIQLIFYAWFYRTTPKHKESKEVDDSQSQIQMV